MKGPGALSLAFVLCALAACFATATGQREGREPQGEAPVIVLTGLDGVLIPLATDSFPTPYAGVLRLHGGSAGVAD
jgi:hypothetical protein